MKQNIYQSYLFIKIIYLKLLKVIYIYIIITTNFNYVTRFEIKGVYCTVFEYKYKVNVQFEHGSWTRVWDYDSFI